MANLADARAALLLHRPYYGHLALSLLSWREDANLPFIAATDERSVLVNPARVENLTIGELAFVVAHELEHTVRMHCTSAQGYWRRGLGPDGKSFNAQRWNIAADLLINSALRADGFTVLDGALLPERYGISVDAMADDAAAVYCRLPADPSGQGHDEHRTPGEGEGGGEAQRAQQIARAVASAISAAKAQGKLPAHVERTLTELTKQRASLADFLQRWVSRHSAPIDYSWRKPRKSRLCFNPSLYLPSLVGQSAGRVVVGIDTSGSIDQRTLARFLAAVAETFSAVAVDTLQVVALDAQIHEVHELQKASEVEALKFSGGGGTNMPALFDWIAQSGEEPDQVLILTDGYTPFGTETPYPVLWAIDGEIKAPWGITATLPQLD